ncbi:MAG: ABC transporter substrate-binding protein [Alphaproteobacteria bacterium]
MALDLIAVTEAALEQIVELGHEMAMLGGSVQFINHSALLPLEAYMEGADTVLVGTGVNNLDHSLMVLPSITTVQDLRGKIIGISALGSLTHVALREALPLNGLSERDVTVLPVGDLNARMSALQNVLSNTNEDEKAQTPTLNIKALRAIGRIVRGIKARIGDDGQQSHEDTGRAPAGDRGSAAPADPVGGQDHDGESKQK